jgi:sulfate-transporting ATPase
VVQLHVPFIVAALVGILATIPVGLVIGLPAVRTRGASLAVITLGFAVALQTAVFNNPDISGGFSGLIPGPIDILGLDITAIFQPRRYAVLVLLVFVLVGILALRLRRSPAGLRMVAVRGNERAAASLGIGVALTKLRAFVTSAVIAGVGGVLIAFSNYAVALGNPGGRFDPSYSLTAIAESTLGGIGFVSGTVVGTVSEPGAVVAKALAFLLAGPGLTLVGGLLLLVTIVTAPSGVVPNMIAAGAGLAGRLPGAARRRERGDRQRAERHTREFGGDAVIEAVPAARLAVDGLSVVFGATRALDGVSLVVEPGQVLGVIGPNGAGKTTLVDAITGYSPARSGQVSLDGADITRRAPHVRARMGVVRSFQSLEVFEDLTVRQNLLVAADDRSWLRTLLAGVLPVRARLSDRALAAVRAFHLEDRLDVSPGALSFGERRLLAIARALAAAPRVLLLDEPAAGLSALERDELRLLVQMIARDWGIAVLLIEHDVDLVLAVSDRVVALDFGRVIAEGDPEQIRHDPAVIAAYLGSDEEVPA